MTDWLDIKDAPRDGTPIVGGELYRFQPYKPDPRHPHRGSGRWQRWNGWGWDNSPAPEGWMPAKDSRDPKIEVQPRKEST